MGTIYQVSTISALSLGYTKSVITVEELLRKGSVGLGTYEDVNGEMIVIDDVCYQAQDDGSAYVTDGRMGASFAAVGFLENPVCFALKDIADMTQLEKELYLKVEEGFGLNSVHIAQIDGTFEKICARSESPYRSHHVELKEILKSRQEDFSFENIEGTLVAIYFPDYLDSINVSGWHFHFISGDRRHGGHVFDLKTAGCSCKLEKMDKIEIQLPKDAAFDTYSLKKARQEDIEAAEKK